MSRSAWNNEEKVFSFVAIHDFKQHCSLCFVEQSKECSIAKNEARPADPTKSNNVFSCLPNSHFPTEYKLTVFFPQFCYHLHIKLLQLVFCLLFFAKLLLRLFFLLQFFSFLLCLYQQFCHPGKNTGESL